MSVHVSNPKQAALYADRTAALPAVNVRSGVLAGVFLAVAGVAILMGIITAEALYPAVYTTHENEISDLGATRPPNSIIHQPSARIFNASMMISGGSVIVAAVALWRTRAPKRVWITTGLLGIGALGVGVFPGNYWPHGLFAMLTFVAGGLAGVLAGTRLPAPFRFVSIALGGTALASLAIALFGDTTPIWRELGDGGLERWVAYPVILWLVALGGFLAGNPNPWAQEPA